MLKLALPAGDLRKPLAQLLARAGLSIGGYGDGSRSYRLRLDGHDGVLIRVFRERDISIQIALGNYDLGICGLAWVEEFLARYPQEGVVKVRGLGVGASRLYVGAAPGHLLGDLGELARVRGLRIASEYANLAEAFAMAARLPGYRILPVWGVAETYPPEDAELALVAAEDEDEVRRLGLVALHELLAGAAWLVANRDSLREKDLSPVLGPVTVQAPSDIGQPCLNLPSSLRPEAGRGRAIAAISSDKVRIALPDGHLQKAAVQALETAGLPFEGYNEAQCQRRPGSPLAGLEAKVIRPQDMPQLVASGSFHLAITGRDCLRDHLYRFPSSPVQEVADLGLGQFNLCAVVSQGLPADSLEEALQHWRLQERTVLRVASEFVNIADHYARSHHLWRYRIIPIAGASEGFVPEDAELLIEGTETGRTLAENNLKAIDVLFRSTMCLIARPGGRPGGSNGQVFNHVVSLLS